MLHIGAFVKRLRPIRRSVKRTIARRVATSGTQQNVSRSCHELPDNTDGYESESAARSLGLCDVTSFALIRRPHDGCCRDRHPRVRGIRRFF